MEQAVVSYLKHLDIPISEEYCNKIILSHPDFPSLLSISDAFSRLGVPCQIGKIEQKHLSKIEFPFLIHLESSREGLVLIKSSKDLDPERLDLTQWDGIVLKAEATAEIKDAKHNEELKKEQLTKKISVTLLVSLFGILATILIQSFTWINTVLLGTSIVGLTVGYLLFAKELGFTYKSVESFCNTSTRVNCDKILASDGANILSFFSLSDAVFSYFAFQLIITGIVLVFLNSVESYLWVLAVGSGLSIPMVIYSIYYQGMKARTWCKLCMVVNAVLIVQASFFGFLFVQEAITIKSIEFLPFIVSLFFFLIIASSIVLLKEKNEQASKAANAEIAGNRVKYAPEVFAQLLFQGTKVDYAIQGEEMLIGNRTAPLNVLMVANLNCHPCKIGFEDVLELLNQYPEHVNVMFRFLISGNKVHDIPASTFLIQYWKQHISGTKEESGKTIQLIQDWYAEMSAEKFGKKYSAKIKESDVAEVHYHWITKNKIERTPTFFLNGYEYPSNYTIKDIGSLIAGLIPLLEEKNMPNQKAQELAL
ncbi:MAG: vitamin K epoxide reductase family protein [Balneola sp.]